MNLRTRMIIAFALAGLLVPAFFIARSLRLDVLQTSLSFLNYEMQVSNQTIVAKNLLKNVSLLYQNKTSLNQNLLNLQKYHEQIQHELTKSANTIRTYLADPKLTEQTAMMEKDLLVRESILERVEIFFLQVGQYLSRDNQVTKSQLNTTERQVEDRLNELVINSEMRMTNLQSMIAYRFKKVVRISVAFVIAIFSTIYIVILIMTRKLIKRINKIKHAADDIAAKKYETKVEDQIGDEITVLANAINDLTASTLRVNNYITNILNAMPNLYFLTAPNLDIKKINKTANETLGYCEKALLHHSLSGLIASGSVADVINNNHTERFTLLKHNGVAIPMLFSAKKFFNAETNEIEMICIAQDITVLEETERKAVETARLAGMVDVATSILHTVGNVLNSLEVAVSVIANNIFNSKINSMEKLAEKLKQHQNNMEEYLLQNDNAKIIARYILEITKIWDENKNNIQAEITTLREMINKINDTIAAHQNMTLATTKTGIINGDAKNASNQQSYQLEDK